MPDSNQQTNNSGNGNAATLAKIQNKLANNNLQNLKIYSQKASDDINTMINEVLENMWSDITCKMLDKSEMHFCETTFANAVITNLVDKQAQHDLDTLFTNILASYSIGKFDTIFLSQMLRRAKMPEPSQKCIYVASDVSEAAKDYDTQKSSFTKDKLLASLGAFYANTNAVYMLFDDDKAFDTFKSNVNIALKQKGLDPIPDDFTIKNKCYDLSNRVMIRIHEQE